MPYTRLILLSGSVAAGAPHQKSDLDIIVVSENNKVWLNRFFLELMTLILGVRRNQIKFENRICFNMFLGNASPILPHRDTVAAECYRHLKIIWSENKNEIKIFGQKNIWLKDFVTTDVGFQKNIFDKETTVSNIIRKSFENIFNFTGLGFLLEKISYKLQKKYLEKRFLATGGTKNKEADYLVTPQLAAYHFPVSNYSRAAKKHLIESSHVEKR